MSKFDSGARVGAEIVTGAEKIAGTVEAAAKEGGSITNAVLDEIGAAMHGKAGSGTPGMLTAEVEGSAKPEPSIFQTGAARVHSGDDARRIKADAFTIHEIPGILERPVTIVPRTEADAAAFAAAFSPLNYRMNLGYDQVYPMLADLHAAKSPEAEAAVRTGWSHLNDMIGGLELPKERSPHLGELLARLREPGAVDGEIMSRTDLDSSHLPFETKKAFMGAPDLHGTDEKIEGAVSEPKPLPPTDKVG